MRLAVLAIIAVIAGTFALLWLVWRSPHRNDLATFGSYAGAVGAIAVGLIGTVVGTITRTSAKRKKVQGSKHNGRDGRKLEFAHLGVTDKDKPNWEEKPHIPALMECPFPEKSHRYFCLPGGGYDADLFFDVTVLNKSGRAVIFSRIGAEILQVAFEYYGSAYGSVPPAFRPLPAEDGYVLQTPTILQEALSGSGPRPASAGMPVSVNRESWMTLQDPVYLKKGAPYRFILNFKNYQRNMPNHALIQLLAEAGGEVVRSHILHVFTSWEILDLPHPDSSLP
jgi:hypothetical protein